MNLIPFLFEWQLNPKKKDKNPKYKGVNRREKIINVKLIKILELHNPDFLYIVLKYNNLRKPFKHKVPS